MDGTATLTMVTSSTAMKLPTTSTSTGTSQPPDPASPAPGTLLGGPAGEAGRRAVAVPVAPECGVPGAVVSGLVDGLLS
jgi:hypothetical protein